MLKNQIRKKILKIRKIKNLKNVQIRFNKIFNIIKKSNIKGKIIERTDLMYARPANNIDSSKINTLIGKKSTCDIKKGQSITYIMFE